MRSVEDANQVEYMIRSRLGWPRSVRTSGGMPFRSWYLPSWSKAPSFISDHVETAQAETVFVLRFEGSGLEPIGHRLLGEIADALQLMDDEQIFLHRSGNAIELFIASDGESKS